MKFETDIDNNTKMDTWLQRHILDCSYWQPNYVKQQAGKGTLSYVFTPAQGGLVIEVQCRCGQQVDVTNYDEW